MRLSVHSWAICSSTEIAGTGPFARLSRGSRGSAPVLRRPAIPTRESRPVRLRRRRAKGETGRWYSWPDGAASGSAWRTLDMLEENAPCLPGVAHTPHETLHLRTRDACRGNEEPQHHTLPRRPRRQACATVPSRRLWMSTITTETVRRTPASPSHHVGIPLPSPSLGVGQYVRSFRQRRRGCRMTERLGRSTRDEPRATQHRFG